MPKQPVEATQHHRCVLTLARLPSVMVDLRTAMAAAQAEQKRRQDRNPRSPEKKKNRSGADLGIDPFDPVKYVNKERADTASMWLVIVYSLVVTCLMRFVAASCRNGSKNITPKEPGSKRSSFTRSHSFPSRFCW